jgi:hypothetical protein
MVRRWLLAVGRGAGQTANGQRPTANEIALVASLIAIAALFILLGHGRWLDPIIDAGRDLYVPEQLAHGARLYKDIDYNYPPLAPRTLALAVRLFGSSLALYEIIGGVLAAIAAAAMYMLGRTVAGVAGAAASTLLFVALCVAGRPNFNFFFPYAHAMTFGATLTIIYVALAVMRRDWGVIAGALACATKLEFAFVVIACALVQRRWKTAALCAIVTLVATPIPSQLAGGAAAGFYQRLAAGGWSEMLFGTLALAGVAVLSLRPSRAMALALFAGFCFVSAGMLFAPAPLVHLGLIPFVIRARDTRLPLLWCASITSTARIALHVTPEFNGFAYVLPTIILFVYLALTIDPRARALWLAVFAGVAVNALWVQADRARQPAERVQTPRGAYLDTNADRAAAMSGVLEALRAEPAGTLAVVPEGVSINYFSGRRTPLRRYLFTPPETGDPRIEADVIREWRARPPDFVAVTTRSVSEYGSRGFGEDYDRDLARLIAAHYARVGEWGGVGYTITLMRRQR